MNVAAAVRDLADELWSWRLDTMLRTSDLPGAGGYSLPATPVLLRSSPSATKS